MAEPAGLRAGSAGSSDGAGSGDPAGLARPSSRGPTHSSHADRIQIRGASARPGEPPRPCA
ncbi:hypothetical protein HMPREF0043_02007 [Actinobaculum sp. oral taxon 183 str. F0552]|nr:hypothetical protein HMPREF0043_02007 [Actinobaculum sp. oral taxon 183 str. F0552]